MLKEFKEVLSTGDLQAIVSSSMGKIILWVISILLVLLVAILSGSNTKGRTKVKQLVYSSLVIALSTVLSYIKIYKLPQGGSISAFSMLVLALIGYWYGVRSGILCGFVYGILQLILDGYVVHPIQLLLDYPVAFAMLGLSGIFKNSERGLVKGLILGAFGRFLCSFISGVVFFSEYAASYNMAVIPYSIYYNGSYIGLEVLLSVILLMIPAFDKAMKQIKVMALKQA